MRTWSAATLVDAPPDAVLDVLTDPGACARWSPVDFAVDDLDAPRLRAGSRTRISGRLAGLTVAFEVDVVEAGDERLALRAVGPIDLDVAYELAPAQGGSEVRASIGVRAGSGLRGRVLAQATTAVLRAGALDTALGRIGREAMSACPA